MNVGLVARSEHRGLGNLSLEWYRHMRPDRTLVVVPDGVRHAHLTSNLDWYPDATVVNYSQRGLSERACREWLADLDVVISMETFYDWRFCRWAAEARCATVCWLMPEWLVPGRAAEPTVWWAPTSWRLEQCPPGTRHIPVPVPADRFDRYQPRAGHRTFRWLHIGGARTHADRNGTGAVLDAARLLADGQHLIVHTQSPLTSSVPQVTIIDQDLTCYWQMYDLADGVVMPRRYAGLCLPVLEAFGKGLPVVMTDLEPQRSDWPVRTVTTTPGSPVPLPGGNIPTGDADPHALAATMNAWAADPVAPAEWAARVRAYAGTHSWAARKDELRHELEQAADRAA